MSADAQRQQLFLAHRVVVLFRVTVPARPVIAPRRVNHQRAVGLRVRLNTLVNRSTNGWHRWRVFKHGHGRWSPVTSTLGRRAALAVLAALQLRFQ